jgi:RNA polymerase sigma factor (sigma-70 family)
MDASGNRWTPGGHGWGVGNKSEHDLWARSLKGDGEAFGVLFDRHHPVVFRRALYLVGERSAAEDVVATAFLELWRRRDAVRVVDGSVLAWLLVTTTNVSRNIRRGTRRYRALLERLPRLEPGPDAAEVYFSAGPPQDDELVAALGALRERDLQIITLVVLEGFSIADAAQVLGLTPNAAKVRLHRARARLRERLAGHPEALRRLTSEEGVSS